MRELAKQALQEQEQLLDMLAYCYSKGIPNERGEQATKHLAAIRWLIAKLDLLPEK
jgi:hypothetical protein